MGLEFIKFASAIQYKSKYEFRSVIAPTKTKAQFPNIFLGKMGTVFVSQTNRSKQYSYIEVSGTYQDGVNMAY